MSTQNLILELYDSSDIKIESVAASEEQKMKSSAIEKCKSVLVAHRMHPFLNCCYADRIITCAINFTWC